MTKDELQSLLLASPEIRGIKTIPEPQKPAVISSTIDLVVTKIVLANDWDFATDVADEPVQANVSDYTLRGNDQDALAIFNVRYGTGTADSGYQMVDKRKAAFLDDYMSRRSPDAAKFWVVRRRQEGFPSIRIVGVPTAAGANLRYRYWVKGLQFSDLPEDIFDDLALAWVKEKIVGRVAFVEGLVQIVQDYKEQRKEALREVIERYQAPGGEIDPIRIDPERVLRNNRRAHKFGYGG